MLNQGKQGQTIHTDASREETCTSLWNLTYSLTEVWEGDWIYMKAWVLSTWNLNLQLFQPHWRVCLRLYNHNFFYHKCFQIILKMILTKLTKITHRKKLPYTIYIYNYKIQRQSWRMLKENKDKNWTEPMISLLRCVYIKREIHFWKITKNSKFLKFSGSKNQKQLDWHNSF